jgi:hypothetical protein
MSRPLNIFPRDTLYMVYFFLSKWNNRSTRAMKKGILRNVHTSQSRIVLNLASAGVVFFLFCSFAQRASTSQAGPYSRDLELAANRAVADFAPDANLEKSAW